MSAAPRKPASSADKKAKSPRRIKALSDLTLRASEPRLVRFRLQDGGEELAVEVHVLPADQSDKVAAFLDDIGEPPLLKPEAGEGAPPVRGGMDALLGAGMRDYSDPEYKQREREAVRKSNALSIALAIPDLALDPQQPIETLVEKIYGQLPQRVINLFLEEIENASTTSIVPLANFSSASASEDSPS